MFKLLIMFYVAIHGIVCTSEYPLDVTRYADAQTQVDDIKKENNGIAPLARKLTGLSSQVVKEVWNDFYTKTSIHESAEDQWKKFFQPKLLELSLPFPQSDNLVSNNTEAFSLIVRKIREQKKELIDL